MAPNSTSSVASCLCPDPTDFRRPVSASVSGAVVLETVVITTAMTFAFAVAKTAFDRLLRRRSRATVVIVGAGPAGVLSTWLVARTGRTARIVVFEERSRADVVARTDYLCLDGRSLRFLRSVGLEVVDGVRGEWQHQNYGTTKGPFLRFVLDALNSRWKQSVDIRFETKFTKDCLKELDSMSERIVAVVCDGSNGRSAGLLGLSDEFTQHFCLSYGAMATVDSSSLANPPSSGLSPDALPEIRVHHLAIDHLGEGDPFPTSFHLKIFGRTHGRRSLALAVPRCESSVVRALKTVLDQSVMRSIFLECYNRYRSRFESAISDAASAKCLKFSPRLFEIKLLQRLEAAVYIEDADVFVVTEGTAARRVNFCSGMGINLVVSGLTSLGSFVEDSVWVNSEKMILRTLQAKLKHGQAVARNFVRQGIRDVMYS